MTQLAVDSRKVTWFLGLTFSVSYGLVLVYRACGGWWAQPAIPLLGAVYMLIPLTCAVIVQGVIGREPAAPALGISWKLNGWFLVAWGMPLALAFAAFGVGLLLPGVAYAPDMAGLSERIRDLVPPERFREMQEQMSRSPVHPFWLALVAALTAGPTINALGAFGEEAGWRGLLMKELAPLGFWRSSAVIGFIWGAWHAPLILLGANYPQHPQAGVLMMTAFTMLLSPLIGYVRLQADSVLAAAVWHGSLNASAGLSTAMLEGGGDLVVGMTGLAGLTVLALANVGLWFYERGRGSARPRRARPNAAA